MLGRWLTVGLVSLFGGVFYLCLVGDHNPTTTQATLGDMESIKGAFLSYYQDTGFWPPVWDTERSGDWGMNLGYECLFTNACNLPSWNGPYLDREYWTVETDDRIMVFGDPWGNPYVAHYIPSGDEDFPNGAILIHSAGPDSRFADSPPSERLEWTPPCDDIIREITLNVSHPDTTD